MAKKKIQIIKIYVNESTERFHAHKIADSCFTKQEYYGKIMELARKNFKKWNLKDELAIL